MVGDANSALACAVARRGTKGPLRRGPEVCEALACRAAAFQSAAEGARRSPHRQASWQSGTLSEPRPRLALGLGQPRCLKSYALRRGATFPLAPRWRGSFGFQVEDQEFGGLGLAGIAGHAVDVRRGSTKKPRAPWATPSRA